MVKKKTTKEVRAIDGIIKFQIDDGIESLTISGKEALADLEIDNKNNVTLYLNADKDKMNELHSLVPFINLAIKEEGADPDKQKSVTLSQDLTQFALEIADNSKELASIIKSESSIILDLDGLVQKLLEIAGKMAELEAKDLEQDRRLTAIEAKDLEQDNRLTELESNGQEQESELFFGGIGNSYIVKDIPLSKEDTPINANHIYSAKLKWTMDNNEEADIYNTSHFITHIYRYKDGVLDGKATIISYSNGGIFDQDNLFEMRTVSSGDIKLFARYLNNSSKFELHSPQIVAGAEDENITYTITMNGFKYDFHPIKVLW